MKILRQVSFYLLAILICVLPFYQRGVLSLLIGLLVLVSFFRLNKHRKIEWLNLVFSGFGLFVILALSMLWTADTPAGFKLLETKLSFLLLPFVFGFSPPIRLIKFKKWMYLMVVSFSASLVYYLIKAVFRYMESDDPGVFFYAELGGFFHASYLSLYYTVVIAVILLLLLRGKVKKKVIIGLHLALVLMLTGVVLLSAKTGILSAILLLICGLLLGFLSKNYSYLKKVIPPYLVLFLCSVFFNPTSSKRISAAVNLQPNNDLELTSEDEITRTKRSSTESRLIVWKLALEIFKENPRGVGEGDVKQALEDKYEEHGEYFIKSRSYNAHNQFLESALSAGVLGLGFMLLMFGYLVYRSVKLKDWLLLAVVLIVGINLLTESMFQRQSGAVFIALIFSILVFRDKEELPN